MTNSLETREKQAQEGTLDEEARLDELAALGTLQRGSGSVPEWAPITIVGPGLAAAIDDDRGDRF